MTGPAIYDANPNRPDRLIKRGPTPGERRALADLKRAVRMAAAELTAVQLVADTVAATGVTVEEAVADIVRELRSGSEGRGW